MAAIKVNAKLTSPGTINWAIITVNGDQFSIGGGSRELECDANGVFDFILIVNAFPGTGFQLTLTKDGEEKPRYTSPADDATNSQGIGRDAGKIDFS